MTEIIEENYSKSNPNVGDFDVSFQMMTPEQIEQYDDIDGWIEWEKGELEDLSPEEIQNEAKRLRGEYVLDWLESGKWPPIVIIDSEKYRFSGLADERGRFSIAYGLNIPQIPVALLTDKGAKKLKNKTKISHFTNTRRSIVATALVLATEEWYDLPEGDSLNDSIWALYELEFKYSQLKAHADKWQGTPQRYDNTLNKMGELLLSVIEDVAEDLLPVYENWLSSHAITKPKKWAKARYKDTHEFSTTEEIYQSMNYEYKRYANEDISKEINRVTKKHIDELPRLKTFLEAFSQEEKDRLEEDRDSYDEEEFEEQMKYLDSLEGTWENIMDAWGVDEFINSFVIHDPSLSEELFIFWYEKIIFPVWYGHWKDQGIDETRERVEDRYKELKELSGGSISDPQKAAGMINQAIQESHQTGEMMEYVSNHHDVDYDILEQLSDADTSEWGKN